MPTYYLVDGRLLNSVGKAKLGLNKNCPLMWYIAVVYLPKQLILATLSIHLLLNEGSQK